MIARYSGEIENLMHNIEHLINRLLRSALHKTRNVCDRHKIYFDIFTYGGVTGIDYKYVNINSMGVLSGVPLKIYFNGTVTYKRKYTLTRRDV